MAEIVTELQLRDIPVPEETKSYMPLPHNRLIDELNQRSLDIFGELPSETSYEIARDGKQLFGQFNYTVEDSDMNLSIGFRNSYDKSLSVGLCAGSRVIVCSNLMFVGDIMAMRSHTKNMYNDLDILIDRVFDSAQDRFVQASEDAETMDSIDISDHIASKLVGEMYMQEEILTPNLLNIVKKGWFDMDGKSTLWKLYNGCTDAMKKSHVSDRMNKQTKLHQFFMDTATVISYEQE